MDVALVKLFGSQERVKILRLFLANPSNLFASAEVAKRTKIRSAASNRELLNLHSIGFLLKKTTGKVKNWQLNPNFLFLSPLRQILRDDFGGRKKELIRQLSRCGRLLLLIISGVFIEEKDSRTDLLIVGLNFKNALLERVIRNLEAELGRELNYSVLDREEFLYRVASGDRFIRDVLDYPHQVVVKKINF